MCNANEPAMPVLTQSPSLQNAASLGLTKREYFAGLALQGIIANCYYQSGISRESHIKESVVLADLLIAELDKGKEEK